MDGMQTIEEILCYRREKAKNILINFVDISLIKKKERKTIENKRKEEKEGKGKSMEN